MTYQKALRSTRDRVSNFLEAGLSITNRSENWNSYCASTVPYLASIIPATRHVGDRLRYELGRLFHTRGWIRRDMIWNIGPALCLKGSPRDPRLVADTASIMAVCRGGLAGPRRPQTSTFRMLQEVIRWVGDEQSGVMSGTTYGRGVARARTHLSRHLDGNIFSPGTGVARALYTAIWDIYEKQRTLDYLAGRSRGRRWNPSQGEEWKALTRASNWTEAWIIARIYCGGIPGTASRRRRTMRRPHVQCWGCGASGRLVLKWLSQCIDLPRLPRQVWQVGAQFYCCLGFRSIFQQFLEK